MALPPYLHLFLLGTFLLSLPYLSLSQSQISLPPAFPPTSSSSSSDTGAPSPDLSVSIPPSSSPFSSPPATSPSSDDLSEAPAPSPLSSSGEVPVPVVPVPVPAPSLAEVKASAIDAGALEDTEKKGLVGGKKAGVVVGVFAATALVGLGVLVCKKRQDNIRRSRYGYSSRSVELV